jgi:RsiW-degrading membrane proteinase PrsW (M82 family)
LAHGATASLAVVAVRSFSSSFLHASSTATMGYGLAKSWLTRRAWAFLPYYFIAVIMHATFNVMTTIGLLVATPYGETIGFGAAVAFAIVAITIVRIKLASPSRTALADR